MQGNNEELADKNGANTTKCLLMVASIMCLLLLPPSTRHPLPHSFASSHRVSEYAVAAGVHYVANYELQLVWQ